MFGKKFFSTVALGGATISLVGISGQVLAQHPGISVEEVALLQRFVDFLDVSKSEFQMLCDNAEFALRFVEHNANSEGGHICFTVSAVERVKGIDVNQFLLPGNEKILAVFVRDGFSGDEFHFYNRENTSVYWYVGLEELRYYLQEMRDNASLLEFTNFRK